MAESKPKAAEKDSDAAVKESTAQVDEAVREAEEKGYIGETPDDTPNRNYTVAGVLEGAETPETKAREA